MKAIILAAGISSRLRPYTNENPKALLKVNEQTILSYTLDSLKKFGINDVIICVGFLASKIIDFCKTNYGDLNIIFIKNNDYSQTNNMYSLYLARDHFDDDIILFNGDAIHDPVIIETMLQQKKTSMAVDRKSYDKESMKIIVNNKGIIQKMSKQIPKDNCYACSVDIFKIVKSDLTNLKKELERIIEDEKNLNEWIETMFVNLFKKQIVNVSLIDFAGKNWYEIDTYEDLKKARDLFQNKK